MARTTAPAAAVAAYGALCRGRKGMGSPEVDDGCAAILGSAGDTGPGRGPGLEPGLRDPGATAFADAVAAVGQPRLGGRDVGEVLLELAREGLDLRPLE